MHLAVIGDFAGTIELRRIGAGPAEFQQRHELRWIGRVGADIVDRRGIQPVGKGGERRIEQQQRPEQGGQTQPPSGAVIMLQGFGQPDGGGEKRQERSEDDERNRWHLSERRYGRFSRSFVLPRDVESDRIEARFEHGVLRVTVPKSEKARRRRIEIQGEDGGRRLDVGNG